MILASVFALGCITAKPQVAPGIDTSFNESTLVDSTEMQMPADSLPASFDKKKRKKKEIVIALSTIASITLITFLLFNVRSRN